METAAEATIAITAIAGGCLMVVFIVYLVVHAGQRSAQIKADVQAKLIDKFGTAPELVAFLQSPAGQNFVGGIEAGPKYTARERIISGVRRAIILGFLGLGFLTIAIVEERGFIIPGLILLGLGIGY